MLYRKRCLDGTTFNTPPSKSPFLSFIVKLGVADETSHKPIHDEDVERNVAGIACARCRSEGIVKIHRAIGFATVANDERRLFPCGRPDELPDEALSVLGIRLRLEQSCLPRLRAAVREHEIEDSVRAKPILGSLRAASPEFAIFQRPSP